MKQKEITQFLEAYRDGIIDPDGARRLAQEIRRGGPGADLVMEELAFSGWISAALSRLDPESFVRSFMERLYAERSTDNFCSSLTTQLDKERHYKTPAPNSKSIRSRLPLALQMIFGSSSADAAIIRRQRHRVAVAASILLVIVTAVVVVGILIFKEASLPPEIAEIDNASAGTVISRLGQNLSVEEGAPVYAGDRLATPTDGYARVTLPDIGPVVLTSDTLIIFGGSRSTEKEPDDAPPTLHVEKGEAIVRYTHHIPCMINTPHARIKLTEAAEFTVTVTSSSTRAQSTRGTLHFTRSSDDKSLRIPSGHYAIATESASFEARKIRP